MIKFIGFKRDKDSPGPRYKIVNSMILRFVGIWNKTGNKKTPDNRNKARREAYTQYSQDDRDCGIAIRSSDSVRELDQKTTLLLQIKPGASEPVLSGGSASL